MRKSIDSKVKDYNYVIQYSKRIPKGQSKIDNLEKQTTHGTQDEDKQNKNTTQCAEHHCTQTNTYMYNVNKA